ncbi:MAG: DUF5615 family PIN-like protein [Chloroflexi bacterium]|nr:DUF5615 family PIN-like protein [Chloroflexota bacterium]
MARPRMLLLIDECISKGVADFFRERGHDVLLVREHFGQGTKDTIIALGSEEIGAVIVTENQRDFKKLVDVPLGERARFRRLGRLVFVKCRVHYRVKRLQQLIESIEFEYEQCQAQSDKRYLFEIHEGFFRVLR